MRVEPTLRPSELRCPYCRDRLDPGDGQRCEDCATQYHGTCASELKGCGTPGCEGLLYPLEPGPKVREGNGSRAAEAVMGLLLGLGLPAALVVPLLLAPPERAAEMVGRGFFVFALVMACARLALAFDTWRRDRLREERAGDRS